MSAAYARAGTAESATRRLNILFAWYIAGRSSESAWVVWSAASWSDFYGKLFVEVPQQKPAKPKYCALGPASDHQMCILVAFADYFGLVGIGIHDTSQAPWVLMDLRSSTQPNSKLGSQMKALLPHAKGGAAGYESYAVDTLPDDISAAGVRHGVVDHTQTQVPIDIGTHGTGHSSRAQESTYRDSYASADRGACSTVQRVLAGFPPPQWGTTSAGPFAPRLDSLKEIGVDLQELDLVIDELFDIHSASNRCFQKGGNLRPFVQACFASQIMAYSDRVQPCLSSSSGFIYVEMREVCIKMQTVLQKEYRVPSGGPHSTLLKWSRHLRLSFDSANIDIMTRTDISGSQLAAQNAVIQKLADSVCDLRSSITEMQQKHDMTSAHINSLMEGMADRDDEKEELLRENDDLRRQIALLKGEEPPSPRYKAQDLASGIFLCVYRLLPCCVFIFWCIYV